MGHPLKMSSGFHLHKDLGTGERDLGTGRQEPSASVAPLIIPQGSPPAGEAWRIFG